MLYNIDKMKIQTNTDCLLCPYFNQELKKCTGYGKTCFEYDPKTKTIFDPVTRLPLKK